MTQTAVERRRKAKDRRLKRVYGIDLVAWEAMWEAQDRRCALCGRRKATKYMALDHNHETGQVRSLICRVPCNRDVVSALDAQGVAGYTRAIDLLILYRQGIPGF